MGSSARAATTHQCSDPCLAAARGERRECAGSATVGFRDDLVGCLQHDRTCVEACRSTRQDCRDATGRDAELLACDVARDAAIQRCRDRYPIRLDRRAQCIARAQVAGERCRAGVRRSFRQALHDCQAAFQDCVDACGVGGPPEGVEACRAQARADASDALGTCRRTFQATAAGCLEKDVPCVQSCADDRTTCNAPTLATLAAAVAACNAQKQADIAACQSANPGGGPALEQCVQTAQANAATCNDAATAAAAPGLKTCTLHYIGCVRGCPAP